MICIDYDIRAGFMLSLTFLRSLGGVSQGLPNQATSKTQAHLMSIWRRLHPRPMEMYVSLPALRQLAWLQGQ